MMNMHTELLNNKFNNRKLSLKIGKGQGRHQMGMANTAWSTVCCPLGEMISGR